MSVSLDWPFAREATFVNRLEGLYLPWEPDPAPTPTLLALNEQLAVELGLDPEALAKPEAVAVLAGGVVPEGTTSVAQAYSGHQFGGYSPRLGDGRAVLLGEVIDRNGRRRDLHLKGSGRTPFARGGDGKAAVGPMLRELIIGEAMYGLGIPTSRALAVVATGETVRRETVLPAAVLCRVAASHLRVGSFQFAAASGDEDLLARLVDYAIERHHPSAAEAESPALGLLEQVAQVQASLVAQWMAVGFIHGVMNTDNTTISGESIDYGPCAFMEAYDPATVFSSIDHGGRYAYGNQPTITAWNIARFAESLLGLIHEDQDTAVASATAVLEEFSEQFQNNHDAAMRAKIGFAAHGPESPAPVGNAEANALVQDLLSLMQDHRVDYTAGFRSLSSAALGDNEPAMELFGRSEGLAAWLDRWSTHLSDDRQAVGEAMDTVNPIYIARNHLVEEALEAATAGELEPAERLLEAVGSPYRRRPGFDRYAQPAPADFGPYQTFCGT